MEDSQQSNLTNISKHKAQANNIERILTNISYEIFTDKEMEALILLTNHIRHIPSEEVENFRIKKYTEAWYIYKNLKDAFSFRKLGEEVKAQLIEYEEYEILAELEF